METRGSIGVAILMDATSSSLENMSFTPVHRKVTPSLVVRESTRSPSEIRLLKLLSGLAALSS